MTNRRTKNDPYRTRKAEAAAIRERVVGMRQTIARTQAEIVATWHCIAQAEAMARALEVKRRKSRAKA